MTRNKYLAPCAAFKPSDKHPAPRNASWHSDKHPAPHNKRTACDKLKGFTLLEVLVALAVLASGTVALGHYAAAFRRVSSAEIARADSALTAVAFLDSLAISLPPCADTVLTRVEALPAPRPHPVVSPFKIRAVYTPVFGPYPLQWVEVGSGNFTLRRLVRCARDSR